MTRGTSRVSEIVNEAMLVPFNTSEEQDLKGSYRILREYALFNWPESSEAPGDQELTAPTPGQTFKQLNKHRTLQKLQKREVEVVEFIDELPTANSWFDRMIKIDKTLKRRLAHTSNRDEIVEVIDSLVSNRALTEYAEGLACLALATRWQQLLGFRILDNRVRIVLQPLNRSLRLYAKRLTRDSPLLLHWAREIALALSELESMSDFVLREFMSLDNFFIEAQGMDVFAAHGSLEHQAVAARRYGLRSKPVDTFANLKVLVCELTGFDDWPVIRTAKSLTGFIAALPTVDSAVLVEAYLNLN